MTKDASFYASMALMESKKVELASLKVGFLNFCLTTFSSGILLLAKI